MSKIPTNNEIGRVILGVVGIATLAAILDKRSSKAKQKRQAAQVAVTPKRQHVIQPRRIDYQQCLRQRWTQSGWQSYVSNRCVNRLNREAGRANPHGQKPQSTSQTGVIALQRAWGGRHPWPRDQRAQSKHR